MREPNSLLPVQAELAVGGRTVAKIKIDEALIWNANLFGHRLEIGYCVLIKANGYLLLQL
jgi:hypothetical protein